jgi:hypothetical protein
MKRHITCVGVLLLAGVLVSCGGGGGGDSPSPSTTTTGTPPNNGGNNGGSTVSKPGRFEETDATVTLSPGHWTPTDAKFGWSGGNAVRSTVAGATVSFQFSGKWVTWIGARNGDGGIAEVSVDGGPARRVDLFIRAQEMRTPVITLHDLSPGQHVLTIRVTGERNPDSTSTAAPVVVVDAFDVEAPILSHLQDRDSGAVYSGTWAISNQTTYNPPTDPTPATDPIDHSANWSGGGVESAPEGPHGGASFTTTAGDKLTLTFRGTSITWQGGHGPDGGIAAVQVDGGPVTNVDTYGPTQKFQEIMFSKTGLADASHTLTITVTDQKNPASAGTKIFVDAFDVTTPGRRFQEDDLDPSTGLPATTYTGTWTRNINRVWSEGAVQRADAAGSRATFTFTGTGVSYIGCQKNSIGPVRITLDGVDKGQIDNFLPSPIEAYNHPIFSIDGLKPGPHTLVVESVSSTAFIVVDAFDVRP